MSEGSNPVTETKVEHANMKETIHFIGKQEKKQRLLMRRAFQDRNSMQDRLTTIGAKLQIAIAAVSTDLDQRKKYVCPRRMPEVSVQMQMNSD